MRHLAIATLLMLITQGGCDRAPAPAKAPAEAPTTPAPPDPEQLAEEGWQRELDMDYPKAVALDQQACDAGSDRACTNLARLYRMGKVTGEPDPAMAVKLVQEGCDRDYAKACGFLGYYYSAAIGFDKPDYAKALLYGRKACERDETPVCHNLAWLYLFGQGVEQDYGKAVELYSGACEREKFASSCGNVAELVMVGAAPTQDMAKVLADVEASCEAGIAGACAIAGRFYRDGVQVERAPETAAALYAKACKLGDTFACSVKDAPAEAAFSELLSTACGEGDASACHALGLTQEFGHQVPPDKEQAKGSYAKACELDHRFCVGGAPSADG